jgi:predicted MPP superfamily phosphohydrolase
MKNIGLSGIIIFITVIFLIDLYTFKGLRDLLRDMGSESAKKIILFTFWAINISLYGLWIYIILKSKVPGIEIPYKFAFFSFGIFLMFLVPKLIFISFVLINDISNIVISLFSSDKQQVAGEVIGRGVFITYLGALLASIPFFSLGWGMLVGRYKYKIHHQDLSFSSLPKAFDGLRIVQISDLHIGSFFKEFDKVETGLQMIRDLKPDMILFTGDLVNNSADEAEPWIENLKKLEAPMGKYSILGNHDYGDYVNWESREAKQENLERLITIHQEMGFDILLNENRRFEKDGESFVLAGVENWGLPPFPQHGDLPKALEGSSDQDFQLLMSHDPSHWDAQVIKDSEVDLTLSGHTHGMQFGVELGNIKWSPVKYKYPKWAGLYENDKQKLYVNRGFGYIGYPGRVGIMPEITLITLKREA